MADAPIVKSRRITRDKLAAVFKSHEMIKAFEDLIEDVRVTMPDAVEAVADDADTVLKASSFSRQSPTMPPVPDAASGILATQIFGA